MTAPSHVDSARGLTAPHMELPRYVLDNASVRDGHLHVCIATPSPEQRRELYAMSWAYSAARSKGQTWSAAELPAARAIAAYVLIIEDDPTNTYIDDAPKHGVTTNLMQYYHGGARNHFETIGNFVGLAGGTHRCAIRNMFA